MLRFHDIFLRMLQQLDFPFPDTSIASHCSKPYPVTYIRYLQYDQLKHPSNWIRCTSSIKASPPVTQSKGVTKATWASQPGYDENKTDRICWPSNHLATRNPLSNPASGRNKGQTFFGINTDDPSIIGYGMVGQGWLRGGVGHRDRSWSMWGKRINLNRCIYSLS